MTEIYIKALREIIKAELENFNAETILINTSIANKIFVNAATYIGSFFPEKVYLFYLKTSNYITHFLYDKNYDREQIKDKFEELGMTFKINNTSYKDFEVPVYPIQKVSATNQEILKILLKMTDNGEWVTLIN